MAYDRVSRRTVLRATSLLLASTAMPSFVFAQDAPKKGGRLTVAADSEPRNLNPAIVASNGVFYVSSKVIEPLAEASFEGKDGLDPRLAVSWEGSPDGLTVTFKLRDGVKWHDGKPFTSADVAFSALQVWKPLQNLGRVVFKDLEAVDTPDELTAVFRFAKPTPFQLIRNALPALTSVVPKHVFDGTDIANNPANNAPIGTGPFKWAEYKPGEYFRLERNADYWDKDAPHLDEIVYRVLPDRAAAAGALEAGEIDLAAFSAVPLADLDRIGKVEGLEVIAKGYEALTYQLIVEINHRRKELADLKVRQAIAHAIDKEFVVKTIFSALPRRQRGRYRRTTSSSIRPTCRAIRSMWRKPTRCSTKPVTRRMPRASVSAEAAAGAVLQRDQAVRRLSQAGTGRDRHRRRDRQQRRGGTPEGGLHRPRLRPRRRAAGVPRRPGDLDHDPGAERHPGRRAVLQPGRLRQCRARRADRQGGGRARSGEARRALP